MSVIQNNLLLSAGEEAYNIQRSLRFRSSASAYLNRTPASAGNRKTWTWSAWVKRGVLGSDQVLFSINASNSDAGNFGFGIDGSDKLYFGFWTFLGLVSTQVLRDPSAWYHIVLAFDSTQATASNRAKLYVNGVQVTAFDTNNLSSITQNADYGINSASATSIFRRQYNTDKYTDGYLTEVNFIDGQALTPSSFGENNAQTGVWQPKRYTGTYGTNGFYLPFTDNSALTTSSNVGLGKDFSGNGNYWTTNNISITSGATYDSMTDVPTLTSATQANFAVLNPIEVSSLSGLTISAGNLNFTTSGANAKASATIIPSSGKWYCELTATTASNLSFGVSTLPMPSGNTLGYYSGSIGWYQTSGLIQQDNVTRYSGLTLSNNDILAIALDADAKTLNYYKNGVLQNGSPISYSYATDVSFVVGTGVSGAAGSINFGQRPFAYTPPTGFVALNTFNLPTPTIGATASTQANKFFNPVIYTGDGVNGRTVSGVGFQPDLVWTKARSTADGNSLADSVRGISNQLYSNGTEAENTYKAFGFVSATTSDGFTLSNGGSGIQNVNTNGTTYVAWNWKANGTGVTNTAGSITSTVSANTSSGFSIVTYTGTGANATVGHGLGVAPKMVIVKNRTGAANNWPVWHSSLASAAYAVRLNSTVAQSNALSWWNNTAPSSTVFNLGTEAESNGNTLGFVAYCFAEVAGFSRFGSYTGNGSADGPFVFCGFRPRFIMVKRSDSTGSWAMFDTSRNPSNSTNLYLNADLSDAEGSAGSVAYDLLSNGFKFRSPSAPSANLNASGGTYIFMAFAENPFKYSLAR